MKHLNNGQLVIFKGAAGFYSRFTLFSFTICCSVEGLCESY